jgi:hypothetical protein
LLTPAPATAAGTATLALTDGYCANGNDNWQYLNETFCYRLYENSHADAVNAVQADLSYDQTKLQFVSAESSSGDFTAGPPPSGGSGSVSIAGGSVADRTGLHMVGTVTFKALAITTGTAITFAGTSAIVRTSDSVNVWNANPAGALTGINPDNFAGDPYGLAIANFWGTDTLASGQSLLPNQYLMSSDGRFLLFFQPNGDVVVYGPGIRPLWHIASQPNFGSLPIGGDQITLQADGNLVLYSQNPGGLAEPYASWWSAKGAALAPGGHLVMQNDGNLVLYSAGNAPVWWSGTGGFPPGPAAFGNFRLATGQTLSNNSYLQSGDKRYALVMQTDCNLVLYGPGFHPIWWSGTRSTNCRLVNQTDGNLVIYNGANVPQWWTAGHGALAPGGHFDLQDDGNMVLYTSGNAPAWFTGTGGKL